MDVSSRFSFVVADIFLSSNPLFDYLIGAAEQRERERDAERLGGLHVDDQLDPRGLLHRQIGRLFALEDAADIAARNAMRVRKAGAVGHEAAGIGKISIVR